MTRNFVTNAKAAVELLNPMADREGTLNALIAAQASVAVAAINAAAKLDALDLIHEHRIDEQQQRQRLTRPTTNLAPDVDTGPLFTPRAQQVLALAARETKRLGITYVGTEQLLVGLIKLGEGNPVYKALIESGTDIETLTKRLQGPLASNA